MKILLFLLLKYCKARSMIQKHIDNIIIYQIFIIGLADRVIHGAHLQFYSSNDIHGYLRCAQASS